MRQALAFKHERLQAKRWRVKSGTDNYRAEPPTSFRTGALSVSDKSRFGSLPHLKNNFFWLDVRTSMSLPCVLKINLNTRLGNTPCINNDKNIMPTEVTATGKLASACVSFPDLTNAATNNPHPIITQI
jgi:hypothetical protein